VQLHVTIVDGHTRHLRLAKGVDALTKADGTVLLAHTIAARMEQRWWRQCRQRYRRTAFAICAQRLRFNATRACDLTQRDGCDLLRTACAI